MTRKNAGVIQLADDGTVVGVSRSGGGGATSHAEDEEEEEAEFEKGPWMAAMDALDAPTFDAGREANRVLSAPCDGVCCDWGRHYRFAVSRIESRGSRTFSETSQFQPYSLVLQTSTPYCDQPLEQFWKGGGEEEWRRCSYLYPPRPPS